MSCKVVQPTLHSESVREVYHDTTITVPGSDVKLILDSTRISDIARQIQSTKDTVFYHDGKGSTTLFFTRDTAGNLQVNCATAEQKYSFLLKELQRISTSQTQVQPKTDWWARIFIACLLILLILQQFKRNK